MHKGLLAQWQGRIVGRGAATAALLAVPVAVAGVIGFNGGLGGVTGGFFSALDGPDAEATGKVSSPGGGLGGALTALIAGPGDGAGGRDDRDRRDGGDDEVSGGPLPLDPDAPAAPPGAQFPGAPDVSAPVDDPQGGVGSLVDGVNNTVGGLVGNR